MTALRLTPAPAGHPARAPRADGSARDPSASAGRGADIFGGASKYLGPPWALTGGGARVGPPRVRFSPRKGHLVRYGRGLPRQHLAGDGRARHASARESKAWMCRVSSPSRIKILDVPRPRPAPVPPHVTTGLPVSSSFPFADLGKAITSLQ
eukprot:scaffold2560_cov397-Prasinococcus_capsulatus_cf.AAC.16